MSDAGRDCRGNAGDGVGEFAVELAEFLQRGKCRRGSDFAGLGFLHGDVFAGQSVIHRVEDFLVGEENSAPADGFDDKFAGFVGGQPVVRQSAARTCREVNRAAGEKFARFRNAGNARFPDGEQINQKLHADPLLYIVEGEGLGTGLIVHDPNVGLSVGGMVDVHAVGDPAQNDLESVFRDEFHRCNGALTVSGIHADREFVRGRRESALGDFAEDRFKEHQHRAAQTDEQIFQPRVEPHIVGNDRFQLVRGNAAVRFLRLKPDEIPHPRLFCETAEVIPDAAVRTPFDFLAGHRRQISVRRKIAEEFFEDFMDEHADVGGGNVRFGGVLQFHFIFAPVQERAVDESFDPRLREIDAPSGEIFGVFHRMIFRFRGFREGFIQIGFGFVGKANQFPGGGQRNVMELRFRFAGKTFEKIVFFAAAVTAGQKIIGGRRMIKHIRQGLRAERGHAVTAENRRNAGRAFRQRRVAGDGSEDVEFFGCGGGGAVVHEIFSCGAEFEVGRGDVKTDGFQPDAVAVREKRAVVGGISGEFPFGGAEQNHTSDFVEAYTCGTAENHFVNAGRNRADVHGGGDALEQAGKPSRVEGHAVEHRYHPVEDFADGLPSRADFFRFGGHSVRAVFVGGSFKRVLQTDGFREIYNGFTDRADIGGGIFSVLFKDGEKIGERRNQLGACAVGDFQHPFGARRTLGFVPVGVHRPAFLARVHPFAADVPRFGVQLENVAFVFVERGQTGFYHADEVAAHPSGRLHAERGQNQPDGGRGGHAAGFGNETADAVCAESRVGDAFQFFDVARHNGNVAAPIALAQKTVDQGSAGLGFVKPVGAADDFDISDAVKFRRIGRRCSGTVIEQIPFDGGKRGAGSVAQVGFEGNSVDFASGACGDAECGLIKFAYLGKLEFVVGRCTGAGERDGHVVGLTDDLFEDAFFGAGEGEKRVDKDGFSTKIGMIAQSHGEIVEQVAAVDVFFMEKRVVSGVNENGIAQTGGQGSVGRLELFQRGFGVGRRDAASLEFVERTEKVGDVAVLTSSGGFVVDGHAAPDGKHRPPDDEHPAAFVHDGVGKPSEFAENGVGETGEVGDLEP